MSTGQLCDDSFSSASLPHMSENLASSSPPSSPLNKDDLDNLARQKNQINKSEKDIKPVQDRSTAELLSETFTPFDHQANLAAPFEEEEAKDVAFERELNAMMLEAMMEFHAWATARPKFESQAAGQRFENMISSVTEREREQGMCSQAHSSYTLCFRHVVDRTRERLHDFVRRMRTALAVLTAIPN